MICQKSMNAYDIHAVQLNNMHNMITFPLLFLTSATAFISNIYIQRTLGAASAILTAVQYYCAYPERAENARMTAKNFEKIIRTMKSKTLVEIQSEIDSTHETANDIPWDLPQEIARMYPVAHSMPTEGNILENAQRQLAYAWGRISPTVSDRVYVSCHTKHHPSIATLGDD